MDQTSADIILFGTTEPRHKWHRVEVAALTLEVCEGKVRKVRWNGVEMIRGVELLVREPNGGTLPATVTSEKLCTTAEGASYECRFDVSGVTCGFSVHAGNDGALTISGDVQATQTMLVNRAGLVILHPMELAGTPFEIRHSVGKSGGAFPSSIEVQSPATDIRGLTYERDGVSIEIALEGEVFEMEDQRNWSDASFKTYSRPLAWPRPFSLLPPPAPPTQQRLVATFGGRLFAQRRSDTSELARVTLADSNENLPAIVVPIEPGWPRPDTNLLIALGLRRLLVRLNGAETIDEIRDMTRDVAADTDLELIVPDNYPEALAMLDATAVRLGAANLRPDHVVAVPRGHPHLGNTHGVATPERLLPRLRQLFPQARIGGGPLTDFADLNCAPAAADADFVTFSTAAVVHDADDDRVVETLTALPRIFSDAAGFAGARPLRTGLVSIGLRRFPAGSPTPDNPEQLRRPAAEADPRQRGLFGAAFAVGVMAACRAFPVESISLAALTGPHGMTFAPATWRQPGFPCSAKVFPVYHVVREFIRLGGAIRLYVNGLAPPIYGVAAHRGDETVLILANLGQTTRTVVLPERGEIRFLDPRSFTEAILNERWLDDTRPTTGDTVVLSPFSTALASLR